MLARIQNGNSTYAVYDLNGLTADIDEVSVAMINNNQNSGIGLAPIRFESMNGNTSKMIFDITGKISLREYIGKNIGQIVFRDMLMNIIESIESFDEYMIETKRVLFDIDSVFINEVDKSVAFICIALKQFEQNVPLSDFFKNIITSSRVNVNDGNHDYFHYAWNVICNASGFSLNNLKMVLKKAENAQASTVNPVPNVAQAQVQNAEPPVQKPVNEQGDVTVANRNSFVPQQQMQPIPSTAKKPEKKGLFSRNKTKKKENPTAYKGGLAGLKSAADNHQSMAAAASVAPVIQPQVGIQPNIPQQPAAPRGPVYGTTVITKDGGIPQPEIPAAKEIERPQIPPQPASAGRVDFGGTTVIEPMQKQSGEPAALQNKPAETSSVMINNNQPSGEPVSVGTTVIHNPASVGTTVIAPPTSNAPQRVGWIVRTKTNEKIMLDKPITRIGRDRPDVDYCVNDNTNVGHLHASIYVKNTGYFIVDHNSKNHTYVNGELIESGKETRLMNNSVIRVADEEFKFTFVLNN